MELLTELDRLRSQRDAALALHRDVGGGQGYDPPDGSVYGEHPHVCGTCGTPDEYAVDWPCATARALGVGA